MRLRKEGNDYCLTVIGFTHVQNRESTILEIKGI